MTGLTCFVSGGTEYVPWSHQPYAVQTVTDDGLPVCSAVNLLRGHIDDLKSAPVRYANEPHWSGIGVDEIRLGVTGHEVDDWVWRANNLRESCNALQKPLTCLYGAVGVEWGLDYPDVEDALRRLAPSFDVLSLECYLDSVNYGRQMLRAQGLLDAAARAGVVDRLEVLVNLSDRPAARQWAEFYAVFGGLDGDPTPVVESYEVVVAHAAAHGVTRFGVWDGRYLSYRSRAYGERLFAGV